MNFLNLAAGVHLGAVATSLQTFLHRTLAYGTQGAAVDGLFAVCAATFTFDMFWQDGNLVELCPQLGGLLAQVLVVVLGGDICIALRAVQSAIRNQVVHGLC